MTKLEILDRLLRLIEIVSACYGSLLVKGYLDKRRERKTDTVSKDIDRKRQAQEVAERMLYELEASRVVFWLFSNGDTTLNGYHLKKLSVFAEANHPGQEMMSPYFQLVPSKQFERALMQLHDASDDYLVTQESSLTDSLSALADQYNIDTILRVKVRTDTGRWVGMVSVCYSDNRELTEGQIAFAKMQAAILGSIK